MKYNPEIHHRRSIRLKNYDYSKSGAYFITICNHERELYFEKYSELVNIINQQWDNLESRYTNIILDEFIVMPNHIHGIIFIENTDFLNLTEKKRADVKPAPTGVNIKLGDIICSFKSLCVNQWLQYIKANNIAARGKFWQRNYYEKIIRNEEQLNKIRQYIIDNPMKWEMDRLNPDYQSSDQQKDPYINITNNNVDDDVGTGLASVLLNVNR